MSASDHLLVIIDPVARRSDGESVRIAKDVLGARAAMKLCLPDNPVEFARALARRGARHLVVVGDDRALLRAVTLLHREHDPESCTLSLVPVGTAVSLAHALGVPAGAVAAARSVLQGVVRRRDLLVDDGGGVVLGDLRIPPGPPASGTDDTPGGTLRPYQSLVRTLAPRRGAAAAQGRPNGTGVPLRVETDGEPLVDTDEPVETVRVVPQGDGHARVEAHPARGAATGEVPPRVRTGVRTVTVSGTDFHYSADTVTAGPVRTRTWTVREGAWGLTLPE